MQPPESSHTGPVQPLDLQLSAVTATRNKTAPGGGCLGLTLRVAPRSSTTFLKGWDGLQS